MLTIKKLHKKYSKRKIQVFENNKLYGEITEAWHWICLDPKMKKYEGKEFEEKEKNLRKIAMENLWWLLHSDNPKKYLELGYTEEEIWKDSCDKWNKGHIIGSSGNISAFLPGEYEIALNSINNI